MNMTELSSSSPNVPCGLVATESAIDAYATRVLQESTPPGSILDTSLGPYVTSVLRASEELSHDVSELEEFESLLELLEDQCNVEPDVATSVLKKIAQAVITQTVPAEPRKHPTGGLYTNGVGSSLDSYPVTEQPSEAPLITLEQPSIDLVAEGPSPLKPSNLIPGDLLGFLDDPSPRKPQFHPSLIPSPPAQTIATPQVEEQKTTNEDAFPPLGVAASKTGNNNNTKAPSSKKGVKSKGTNKGHSDKELAAALFRPSRVRQSSFDIEEAPPPLQSSSDSATEVPEHVFANNPYGGGGAAAASDPYFQQQLGSCVEILLSMFGEVGEIAATEAAIMAHGDFNIAHYIVDRALTAPPICRHALNEGCYRSDCQFSHDVEGHTCLFWLRGRCTKSASVCRFLHGFHRKLMDGMACNVVPTETQEQSFPPPPGFSSNGNVVPTSSRWPAPSFTETSSSNPYSSSTGSGNGISFANIASRGNNHFTSASPNQPTAAYTSDTSIAIPTVKIPQNLWNAHENRDSSVFFIADPMERYRRVAQMNGAASRHGSNSDHHAQHEIIDLHFQSTKTFATVLEQVLPQKLQTATEAGVWIVTGTGHHVGSRTHQKGGGALERSVMQWLQDSGYSFAKGKDRNGLGGALLVRG